MNAVELGTIINHAYQAGGDEATLREVARALCAELDASERASFTDAVEMCGLWLNEDKEPYCAWCSDGVEIPPYCGNPGCKPTPYAVKLSETDSGTRTVRVLGINKSDAMAFAEFVYGGTAVDATYCPIAL